MDELPEVIDKFVNAKGPVLVDFRCVPDICLPMVAPGKGLGSADASSPARWRLGTLVLRVFLKCHHQFYTLVIIGGEV